MGKDGGVMDSEGVMRQQGVNPVSEAKSKESGRRESRWQESEGAKAPNTDAADGDIEEAYVARLVQGEKFGGYCAQGKPQVWSTCIFSSDFVSSRRYDSC